MKQDRRYYYIPLCTGLAAFALAVLVLRDRADATETTTIADSTSTVDFVRDIQPIFQNNCYKCHDGAKHKGGLRLDSKTTAFIGGDSGDASIVPHDPDHSKIIALVRGDDPKSVMPPKGDRLNARQIETLVQWIKQGANWPDGIDHPAAGLSHWSFSKPVRPELPKVKLENWPRNAIDRFVLGKLEEQGLAPSPEADRYTLCRRVYLDLIGLPPSPAQVDAFVKDQSPGAYEKLVDSLQANPHYGERWARIWLDCARYADSAGYGSDPLRKTSFRFRDWVINAFNRNLPYDRFTIEQIAGDLLPNPTTDQLIATGFNRNTMTNTEGGTDREEFRTAAVKDRVETSCQVWMGLTVGCAQCHTHKYDPITNREYYQLFAIFNQTQDADRGDESPTIPTPTAEDESKIAGLKSQIAAADKSLNDRSAWTQAQAKWEKTAFAHQTKWTDLKPLEMTSAGGATLTKEEDGSIIASGTRASTDTYTVTAHTELKGITAFRLTVLPDENQPRHAVGRADDGGFVLSHFGVSVGSKNKAPHGRYVRIDLPGRKKILHLAQVQIFSGDENIARQAKAKQSSTDFNGNASNAIDGNTEGDFKKHLTSHTAESNDPWWEADLGKAIDLDKIVIWNRTDGNVIGRLSEFNVTILDERHKPVWDTHIGPAPTPSLALDLTASRAIALKDASDTFHQTQGGDRSAAAAIESPSKGKNGWSVNPDVEHEHSAIFQTAAATSGPADLTFTLEQKAKNASIAHFRISATTEKQPVLAIPEALQQAIALDSQDRSDQQNAELFDYFKLTSPEIKAKRDEIAKLQKELDGVKPSATAIMREMPVKSRRENHILIKGNFLVKGPVVQPAVLAAFNPLPAGAPADRMGLAKWFIDSDNPLTARVAVNRFWATLFGIGIVETQEDFGTQGQLPSNQALLDWLAVEFREPTIGSQPQPWDMKRLVKMIVTSAAYRQSSRATPELIEKDPRNRLISRGPRRRLEAELVRDQALTLSGLLSEKMFGPSVFPPQPDGLWQAAFNGERTWPASKGEDKYRRGIYVFWRRTVPYPSMSAFDAPSREVCTLRRVPTSTPLQAFVTLNDPVYVECSQALARRIVREGGESDESKAAYALRLCLGHPPEASQVDRVVSLHQMQLEHYRDDLADAKKMATELIGPLPAGMKEDDLAAWSVCANVLLNLDGVLTNH